MPHIYTFSSLANPPTNSKEVCLHFKIYYLTPVFLDFYNFIVVYLNCLWLFFLVYYFKIK